MVLGTDREDMASESIGIRQMTTPHKPNKIKGFTDKKKNLD